MEITLEQVERLRERADLSYEEARAVLEEAEGSLLDALILLERQGRLRPGAGESAHYSTRPSGEGEAAGAQSQQDGGQQEPPQFFGLALVTDGEGAGRFFRNLLRRSLENSLEVYRREELMVAIPLLIAALLLLLAFWVCLPLLVIGLAAGCRYRLAGPDFDRSPAGERVNQAASTVEHTVERMKDQARAYAQEHYHSKK